MCCLHARCLGSSIIATITDHLASLTFPFRSKAFSVGFRCIPPSCTPQPRHSAQFLLPSGRSHRVRCRRPPSQSKIFFYLSNSMNEHDPWLQGTSTPRGPPKQPAGSSFSPPPAELRFVALVIRLCLSVKSETCCCREVTRVVSQGVIAVTRHTSLVTLL
jgi:hypothetical protein